ncbi:MAG: hypothetical protein KR126chlam1_00703 [Chlamydiae bacterium]|nr:hypothetical protein [Chlamydiota bacterium]
MILKIYLVRHGEALSPDIDPEQGLSPAGVEGIEKLSKFLAGNSFPLSAILHSNKARAKQTADILRQHLEPHLTPEEHEYLKPNAPIDDALLRIEGSEEDLMIVSHLPFLNNLVGSLVGGDPDLLIVHFHAGTTVCLEQWDGKWAIDWVVTKSLL